MEVKADFRPGDLGDDGAAWAAAFVKTFPGINEGTMLGWFCNTIEIACDKRGKDQAAEIERLEAEVIEKTIAVGEEMIAKEEMQAQLATMRTALIQFTGWNDDQVAAITDAGQKAADVLAVAEQMYLKRIPCESPDSATNGYLIDKLIDRKFSGAVAAYRAAPITPRDK